MIFTRPKSAISNQGGFTLVELLMVVGIIAALASIGAKAMQVNRQKSFDSQVISLMRSLLTVSAIDEPVGNPGDSIGPGQVAGNLNSLGYPELEVTKNIHYFILNDGSDRWLFYFAHQSGKYGYYFWVPGNQCGANLDVGGNPSDKIFWDPNAGSYRNSADPLFP